MNSLKFLKICRKFLKYQRKPNINLRKCNSSPISVKNTLPTLLMFTLIEPTSIFKSKTEDKVPVNHLNQIKEDCIKSEKKINDLIKTLATAITETCEKYRMCLKKQIDVLENGKTIDPLDEYWDNLVPLRVETNNLKNDFESYRNMVEYVGQLAFNLAFCSALISNLDSKDYVCNEYFELEKIAKEQMTKNKTLEQQLLQKSMESILSTSNTSKDIKDVAASLKKNVENASDK